MTMPAPAVVWFRNDLRIADNPALLAAAATGRPVVPLYIRETDKRHRPAGAASRWWLDKSLRSLGESLAGLGTPLVLRSGPGRETLTAVVAETGAEAVFWNRLYEPAAMARDAALKEDLRTVGVECRSFNAGLLNEPWELKTGAGGPYRVFTPYWRAARPLAAKASPLPAPTRLTPAITPARSEALECWRLHPRRPDWSTGFSDWSPGEAGARDRLERFLARAVGDYATRRDHPGEAATSRLSAHLHFGEIGPRQAWAAAQALTISAPDAAPGVEAFLREIGWREFNHHLLFHFPEIERQGFNPRFDRFAWREDPAGLEAWRHGKTGYPIVDAGMRELWATGWMHNRVRMIVASFLVKDLLIDWRDGEAWFWDTLVDADAANNVAGWQWVAGCGADAAPYFRVFNPVLQGEKFDPEGVYVRRWIPELAKLPNACIHQPWSADRATLSRAGLHLGVTYPTPVVDHGEARSRALAAYERLA